MPVLQFRRPRRYGTPGRIVAALFAVALWLGYGAAAEKWPEVDVAHGLGSNLLFGRDSAVVQALPGVGFVAVDGDTFKAPGHGRVRVLGVDTPELHPCRCAEECALGERAKRRTQALLDGGAVAVQPSGQDRYGRTLARVTVDGRDLGAILIGEGLGRRYGGERRRPWCS